MNTEFIIHLSDIGKLTSLRRPTVDGVALSIVTPGTETFIFCSQAQEDEFLDIACKNRYGISFTELQATLTERTEQLDKSESENLRLENKISDLECIGINTDEINDDHERY